MSYPACGSARLEGRLDVKVYYEDTDCLGVVYHANYLRFFERGRTELMAQLGHPIEQWNEEGVLLAVYKLEVTFRKAARLGERLVVVSRFDSRPSAYRIEMQQRLLRNDELICEARVQLVCLDPALSMRAFPDELLAILPLGPLGSRRV